MNYIDAHVTKVIGETEFDATKGWNLTESDNCFGKIFRVIEVEYWDDGGQSKTTEKLWFEKGKEDAKADSVKEGYVWQH